MKRVGVIRGGKGGEYYSSVKEGGQIILHILENLSDRFKPIDVFIDRSGLWHISGLPVEMSDIHKRVDMIWNTSHGALSSVARSHSIPHITLPAFGSTLRKSKDLLREHIEEIDYDMPRSILLPAYQSDFDGTIDIYVARKAKGIHNKFAAPWIVKSFTEDKNMAIHLAKTFPELVRALEDGIMHGNSILVEEFISGKPSAVHSLSGFRGDDVYVFPPSLFTQEEKNKLITMAKDLHSHLGAEHYLKTDFVIHPKGMIYIIDVSFSPDFQDNSHFAEAYTSVGAKAHHIIEHILNRA